VDFCHADGSARDCHRLRDEKIPSNFPSPAAFVDMEEDIFIDGGENNSTVLVFEPLNLASNAVYALHKVSVNKITISRKGNEINGRVFRLVFFLMVYE